MRVSFLPLTFAVAKPPITIPYSVCFISFALFEVTLYSP